MLNHGTRLQTANGRIEVHDGERRAVGGGGRPTERDDRGAQDGDLGGAVMASFVGMAVPLADAQGHLAHHHSLCGLAHRRVHEPGPGHAAGH
jgi:hypothetical protein